MKIRAYNGLTMYEVESDTDCSAPPYIVDLTFHGGIGKCDCPHYRIRLAPKLVGTPLNADDYRCKHVRACRVYLAEQLLNIFLAQEVAKEQPARFSGQNRSLNPAGKILFRLNQ